MLIGMPRGAEKRSALRVTVRLRPDAFARSAMPQASLLPIRSHPLRQSWSVVRLGGCTRLEQAIPPAKIFRAGADREHDQKGNSQVHVDNKPPARQVVLMGIVTGAALRGEAGERQRKGPQADGGNACLLSHCNK